ncbi:MAG TPA: hypothetical protein VL358_01420 [Caulobacteraceae bacterium]|nr:hypothetical protein [Caulobacteraceae bacterium]
MGAKITNAVVQNGNVTITSAQFVVAGGLSYDDKLKALSTLVEHAAASLDLPHQGPIAAEILYRIADERAGVAMPAPTASVPALQPQRKPRDWRSLALGAAFWVVFCGLLLAAALFRAKLI